MTAACWGVVLLLPALLKGQSPPCLNCESYIRKDPELIPLQILDWECQSGGCRVQEGKPCDYRSTCDHGLTCQYSTALSTIGVCREIKGLPCSVFNQTYANGAIFMIDCRTQCTCQDGKYACASLCPKENISPQGSSCMHPRLVDIPGQCCREWMCDGYPAEQPPDCEWSSWSSCSDKCGAGLSRRSGVNSHCASRNETRLCQLRRCPGPFSSGESFHEHHRFRKGHECKATRRSGRGVRLRFASCLSVKTYRPKWCGDCPGYDCRPELSTTMSVSVKCRQPEDTLEDLTQGGDLWRSTASDRPLTSAYSHSLTVQVEWISKCECSPIGTTTRLPDMLLHRVHRTAPP